MNPLVAKLKEYVSVIISLIVVGLVVGSFFFGRHVENLKHNAADAKALAVQNQMIQQNAEAQRQHFEVIAQNLEDKIAGIQPVFTTINRRIEKETMKTVYTDPSCAFPKTGVDILNQNADELNAKRKAKP